MIVLYQGISSLNIRKLRTNAGDKSTSDTNKVALAAIHNTKYYIPLEYYVLKNHGVLYPYALPYLLSFELTLASVSDIVFYTDITKAPKYKLTSLELEYECINSEYLAQKAAAFYQVGKGFFYENIIFIKLLPSPKPILQSSTNISTYQDSQWQESYVYSQKHLQLVNETVISL